MATSTTCGWSEECAAAMQPAVQSVLCVGGVSLSLSGELPVNVLGSSELFVSASRLADVPVEADWCESLAPHGKAPAFDSGSLWTYRRDDDHHVFDFVSPALGPFPYKRMRMDAEYRSATITMSRSALGMREGISPLEYPADELIVTNYLAHHGIGVEVHGCGMIDSDAGGVLFLGHSGAGKSTTTRVWEYFRAPEILSDDRLILRIHDGELWMYGTPWHGEAEFASPGKAKLNRIFVLQQGKRNEIRRLSKTQAVGEAFARSFPPFHSAAGLEGTVHFLSRIFDLVNCYEFSFVPDRSSVEAVLSFHG